MTRLSRWWPYALLVLVLLGALAYAARPSGHDSQQARVDRITAEVRCPQCQGLSAKDSDAPAAQAVRVAVADMVRQSQSDAQIRASLAHDYGNGILLRPPSTGVGGLVWALPIVAVICAAAGLAVVFARGRHRGVLAASDADVALVASARRRRKS